ncbi:MAG: hypothetical protein QOG69_2031 [Actinomycetota bacterium]|jgi:hypothetical protein|nr:hypothetical protein [Actinomycetota bacterium]
MTFYDDAELAAIEIVRLAGSEDSSRSRVAEMHEVTTRVFARHGNAGVSALVIALARHQSAAILALARYRGVTVEYLIDDFEMHKLEQHTKGEGATPG